MGLKIQKITTILNDILVNNHDGSREQMPSALVKHVHLVLHVHFPEELLTASLPLEKYSMMSSFLLISRNVDYHATRLEPRCVFECSLLGSSDLFTRRAF